MKWWVHLSTISTIQSSRTQPWISSWWADLKLAAAKPWFVCDSTGCDLVCVVSLSTDASQNVMSQFSGKRPWAFTVRDSNRRTTEEWKRHRGRRSKVRMLRFQMRLPHNNLLSIYPHTTHQTQGAPSPDNPPTSPTLWFYPIWAVWGKAHHHLAWRLPF